MNKRTLLIGLMVVLSVAWSLTAYAETVANKPNTFFPDLFNSLGSFLYNALPWNWGSWAGPIGDLPGQRLST